ncbi:MAG: isochorismatase family cysteine hydrolase [Rhodanobacter sp.]
MRLALLCEMLESPSRIAVIVIDMQRDFCSPSGALGRAGMNISANERIVRPLSAFVKTMRDAGVLIVWIKQAASPRHMSPAIMRRLRRAPERLELCKQGTAGAELTEGLKVDAADAMVEKFRYSAFFGSSLDQILRSSGIQTTVLVGTAANGCVDATARDASQFDYDVVIARDLTGYSDAALASAALQNLDRHFALVCESSEIMSRMA